MLVTQPHVAGGELWCAVESIHRAPARDACVTRGAARPQAGVVAPEGLTLTAARQPIPSRDEFAQQRLIQQFGVGLARAHHHDRVLAAGHALLRRAIEQSIQAIQHGEAIGAVHAHIQMLGRTVDAQVTQFMLRSVTHRQRLADLAFAQERVERVAEPSQAGRVEFVAPSHAHAQRAGAPDRAAQRRGHRDLRHGRRVEPLHMHVQQHAIARKPEVAGAAGGRGRFGIHRAARQQRASRHQHFGHHRGQALIGGVVEAVQQPLQGGQVGAIGARAHAAAQFVGESVACVGVHDFAGHEATTDQSEAARDEVLQWA